MLYKMVVRQTMFDFSLTRKGNITLRLVRFLNDSTMKKQNNLLLVTENDTVQFFLDRTTRLSHLTREQFVFVSAAARFFGHMRDQDQLPVWLWAGSLKLPQDCSRKSRGKHQRRPAPAYTP